MAKKSWTVVNIQRANDTIECLGLVSLTAVELPYLPMLNVSGQNLFETCLIALYVAELHGK